MSRIINSAQHAALRPGVPAVTGSLQLPALTVGPCVDLDSAEVGAVHSVFARAVNFQVGGSMWTLLAADQADAAFGIRVATRAFDALGLRGGDRVEIGSGRAVIAFGDTHLVVDCRRAPRWQPAPLDALAPGLADRLRLVAAAAQHRCWPHSPAMAEAVVRALHEPDTLGAVLARVVGRGPGATPSGDDVLVGVLAVLTSPPARAAGAGAVGSLRRALLPLLPRTTDISGQLLRQAADGWFGRGVHELTGALISGQAPLPLRQAVQQVVTAGATSGADLCVGLIAAARMFLLTQRERVAA